jgi:dihydroorotate dehydrogenase
VKTLQAIGLAVVFGTAGALAQVGTPPPQYGEMTSGKMVGMGDQKMQMMAMHEQMMADTKAMDAMMLRSRK